MQKYDNEELTTEDDTNILYYATLHKSEDEKLASLFKEFATNLDKCFKKAKVNI